MRSRNFAVLTRIGFNPKLAGTYGNIAGNRRWAVLMFDVYICDRRYLLVLPKGTLIPRDGNLARSPKRKRGVVSVSEEIRRAIGKDGYYRRKLGRF